MALQQPDPVQAMTNSSSRHGRRSLLAAWLVGVALLLIGGGAAFVYGGFFEIGADTPHSNTVFWLMQTVRNRSVAVHAADQAPSDLADPKRIASGAAQYDEMCTTCHLAPGMKRTEISQGLYPRAPELRRGSRMTAAEQFWVIKHGIKMTGMPAWGVTHDDEILWDVVAFLGKMPELTAQQYQDLVKSAPKTHSETMQNMDMKNMNMGGSHNH